ncbi:MAG: hypothetical protein ACR2QO_16210 [Acidimicrobiales bacterium]
MNGRSSPKNGSAAPETATDGSADTVDERSIADLEDPVVDELVADERAESANVHGNSNGNGGRPAEDTADTDPEPTDDAEPEPKADAEPEGEAEAHSDSKPEDDAEPEGEAEVPTESATEPATDTTAGEDGGPASEPETEADSADRAEVEPASEPETEPEADDAESESLADAVSAPEGETASEVDVEAEHADDTSMVEAVADADAQASPAETPKKTTTTDSAEADSTEPPAESPDRYGSPAVSEGLSRGTIPGQAEGLPPLLLGALVRPAVAVLTVCALLGLVTGIVRGSEETVRRELVYTLDESVPDSFLREDRRLLTQVVTMQSDAVLAPVADEHGLTTEDLRGRIDVETIDLSEVLRLEVRAADPQTARSISDAIIDRYLAVAADGASAAANEALLARQAELTAELAVADTELGDLRTLENEDARLQTNEESLERQIDLTQRQIDRLQGLLDDGLANPAAAPGQGALRTELTAAESDLLALEGQLADVRVDRAELTESTTAERALTRRVARLETDLATIDDEIASRELGPIVATPLRELGEPTMVTTSAVSSALRGLGLGALIGIPVATVVALAVRRRQLWRS